MSTLIFEFCFVEWGLYEYLMNNILRTAEFLPTWGFNERYRCRNPHRHFSQLKARPIPFIESPSG
jgi:hypothetical protein